MNQPLRLLRKLAYPRRLSGTVLEAALENVSIGEHCQIRRSLFDPEVVAQAQVVGFHDEKVVLSLMGSAQGLSRDAVLQPMGRAVSVPLSMAVLGTVMNPAGEIVERLADHPETATEERNIDALPLPYQKRISIRDPLVTGVRAIDGLITCGLGQRVGIFSAAGCGKTTLLEMLIEQTEADVFVIGLVGERTREVTEFVESLRHSEKRDRVVVVFATADYSSMERCNAARLATTVAEYMRDQGKNVILFIDSITRYLRALRDLALASGEPPARRGYPASVFDSLPKLLERPGITPQGSITAFYTVLLEGDDEPDPMADEIRSILDGHIYLSYKLAGQGHYPAIDVLRSTSRVMGQVTDPAHLQGAGAMRKLIARLDELQVFIDLGEYQVGQNQDNDRVMALREPVRQWLQQASGELPSEFAETVQELQQFVS